MAKKPRLKTLSTTVSETEFSVMQELDEVLVDKSRADFIRETVLKEAKKTIAKVKRD